MCGFFIVLILKGIMTFNSIESMYFVEKERNNVLADYQLKLVIISFEQVFLH